MTIGIGLIGLGTIALNAHLPAYREVGLNVVAAADIDPGAREKAGREYGIPFLTDDVDELLSRPEVTIVDIASPPQTHPEMIERAARAGKHVLCQKPLALTYEEAKRVVAVAKECGVLLAVNQNSRFSPVNVFIKKALQDGLIGEPFYALIHYGRHEQVVKPWQLASPHLVVTDMSVHHLDLLRFWLGEPESVYAVGTKDPGAAAGVQTVAVITLKFPGGKIASIINDWVHLGKDRTNEWVLQGSHGAIRVPDGSTVQVHSDRLPAPGVFTPHIKSKWIQSPLYPVNVDAFAGAMLDLVTAVEKGREPSVSGEDNLGTIRLVSAAVQSIEEGRVVSLQ